MIRNAELSAITVPFFMKRKLQPSFAKIALALGSRF